LISIAILIISSIITIIIIITVVVMSSSSADQPQRGTALRATVAKWQSALYNFGKLKPEGQPRASVPWELKQANSK
jgi:hypothetical protein